MITKNLSNTPLPIIIKALTISFADYMVKMPDSVEFWKGRYHRARIDYSLSFGAFDSDQLVAFMMTGIDHRNGLLTAFNTGTGVLPSHRGQQLVDQLYAHALPHFKAKGVQQCQLEVIQDNPRAIRVYERIGFQKTKLLHCFKGQYTGPKHDVVIAPITFAELLKKRNPNNAIHSWDNNHQGVIAGGDFYTTYEVNDSEGKYIGYFVVNPKVGYLAQFECEDDDLEKLLSGAAQVNENMATNNIDEKRVGVIEGLERFGLENKINQYEMEWGM